MPQRTGHLTNKLFGQHVIAFRGRMLAVRLMRQSVERSVRQENNLDTPRREAGLNLGSLVGRQLAPVVAPGLQNYNTRSFRHHTIQSRQHSASRITIDPGIDDAST
jgi:hypothetical protein